MERDFMGLVTKKVKEETCTDVYNDSASTLGSAMQWSFSSKVSTLPQILSFKGAQEDRPRKTGYDSLGSAHMTVSAPEALDSSHKTYSGILQKSFIPQYFNSNFHLPHEVKPLPITNPTGQTFSSAMGTPFQHSFTAATGKNVVSSGFNRQPLGGVPVITPATVPPGCSSVVGNTDLRNTSKTSGGPAQMTIFYGGLVCAYDDVSPEKAQAIMLLAGNGPPAAPNPTLPVAQVQAPVPRLSSGDGFVLRQSHSVTPYAGLSSHISITTQPSSQSGGISSNATEIVASKPVGAIASPSTTTEPSKIVNSLKPAPNILMQSAVPQARKASLARFLEKRKERVMSASPYVDQRPTDCCTPEPVSTNFSMNPPSGASPMPAIN